MGKHLHTASANPKASAPPEAETIAQTLRETINSLRLKLAEKIAQAKTDMQSGDGGFFKAIVGDVPVRAELQRQIKEAEQRLAAIERRPPAAARSNAKERRGASKRVLDLEKFARHNPKTPDADLCLAFDRRHLAVPAPWKIDGINTWVQAHQHKQYRAKVHSIIYKYRHPRTRK